MCSWEKETLAIWTAVSHTEITLSAEWRALSVILIMSYVFSWVWFHVPINREAIKKKEKKPSLMELRNAPCIHDSHKHTQIFPHCLIWYGLQKYFQSFLFFWLARTACSSSWVSWFYLLICVVQQMCTLGNVWHYTGHKGNMHSIMVTKCNFTEFIEALSWRTALLTS